MSVSLSALESARTRAASDFAWDAARPRGGLLETGGTGACADAGAERVVGSGVVVDEDGVVGDGWCEAVEDLCVFRRWGCGAKVAQDADETFEARCARFRMWLMECG